VFRAEEAQPTELRSPRLLLRPPRRSDLDPLDEAIHETLPHLVAWLPWATREHSRTDSRRYLRVAQAARYRRQTLEFVIEETKTGSLLGVTGLHRLDWYRRSAGLGYWIRLSAWGQGFATEAAAALMRHAFLDWKLHRIEIHVALENHGSQRVAEKLGCCREGIARDVEVIDGHHLDHVQYSLLSSDLSRGSE